MEFVCPLCNGIEAYELYCLECGDQMYDQGPVVDYMDEYSPYLASDITQLVDGAPSEQCMHIFQCASCDNDKRIPVSRIMM